MRLPPSKGLQRAAAGAAVKRAINPTKVVVTPEQFRAIYDNLRGAVCVCGAHKMTRQSFCRSHYFALPVGLRRALYESDGYAETFIRACEYLKLQAPLPPRRKCPVHGIPDCSPLLNGCSWKPEEAS